MGEESGLPCNSDGWWRPRSEGPRGPVARLEPAPAWAPLPG